MDLQCLPLSLRRTLLIAALALPGCAPSKPHPGPSILLFNGNGISPNDVTAVREILQNNHLDYSTINTKQLNGMAESELLAFRLIIVPGGNYITIGNSLTQQATATMH